MLRALALLLLLPLSSAAAAEGRLAGTLLGGYARRNGGDALAAGERRGGGGAVVGTALYQWGSGVGLGLALGYQTYVVERAEVTLAPCERCPYERTETSRRYAALELGPVLRWARPEGPWRPSVQVGLGYARSNVNDSFRDDLPGAGAHLAVGLEWWVHPRLALRAELRESAVGFLSTDYAHGALWTSALVGVGF